MPDETGIGFIHFTRSADGGTVEAVQTALQAIAEKVDRPLHVVDIDDLVDVDDAILRLLRMDCATIVTVGEDAGRVAEAMATNHHLATFVTVGYEPDEKDAPNVTGVPITGDADALSAQLSEEIEAPGGRGLRRWLIEWNAQGIFVPLLSIFTALIIGAVFIAAFNPDVWEAFGVSFGAGIGAAFRKIGDAYGALLQGAFGSPVGFVRGMGTYISTGDDGELLSAIYPLTESLRIATPYIFTGLAVALGFRSGLFNIGAEGQYFVGGLASTFVGYALVGVPFLIHLPLAIMAGFAGGAFWAAIAGWLKAHTGAHEVITTIMLNYIAFRLADFLLQIGGPMARPNDSRPISPEVLPSAWLPQIFPDSVSIRVNLGLVLALLAVAGVWYLLFKTSLGFQFRTVGANPRAARTAGINVPRTYVLAMALSGGLAGLAGAHDILGVTHYMPNAFQSGYGFDAIALALLGRNNPIGVMFAALLFGFLRAGAQRMQAYAGVPIDIISILQGVIIIFIAAPEVIRMIYRVRTSDEGTEVLTRGWGNA